MFSLQHGIYFLVPFYVSRTPRFYLYVLFSSDVFFSFFPLHICVGKSVLTVMNVIRNIVH